MNALTYLYPNNEIWRVTVGYDNYTDAQLVRMVAQRTEDQIRLNPQVAAATAISVAESRCIGHPLCYPAPARMSDDEVFRQQFRILNGLDAQRRAEDFIIETSVLAQVTESLGGDRNQQLASIQLGGIVESLAGCQKLGYRASHGHITASQQAGHSRYEHSSCDEWRGNINVSCHNGWGGILPWNFYGWPYTICYA